MDFWISKWISGFSKWISGFQIGFLDFRLDFWISEWISGFRWISADSVQDFFRGGPLVIVSTISCHTPTQSPSSRSCQKPTLCKVRVVFSKPVRAVRVWGGPLGTNHGLFKAKPSNHSTLPVTPPTSPCPTLSADAEPAHKRTETIFSAQCAV